MSLNELQAVIAMGALDREHERLRLAAEAARARGDREAWALFSIQRRTLAFLKGEVLGRLGGDRAPSDHCLEVLGADVQRIRARMPDAPSPPVGYDHRARPEPPRHHRQKADPKDVFRLRAAGVPTQEIAERLGITRRHVYRVLATGSRGRRAALMVRHHDRVLRSHPV